MSLEDSTNGRKPSKLMWLVLHPKVYSDIDEIMGYHERVATPGLGEEFYTERAAPLVRRGGRTMVQSRSLWQTSASIPAMSGSIWRNRVTLRMPGKMPASRKRSAEDTSSKR